MSSVQPVVTLRPQVDVRVQTRRLATLIALPDEAIAQAPEFATNPALRRVPLRAPQHQPTSGAPIERAPDHAPDALAELAAQLRLERLPAEVAQAAFELLGWVDDRGLLPTDDAELARRLGYALPTIQAAREALARLDPPGVGARSVVEHLLRQIEERWPEDPFFPDLVRHHLTALQRDRLAEVARALDLDPEDVAEYRAMLGALSPFPLWGRATGEDAPPVHVTTWVVAPCPETGRLRLRDPDDVARPSWAVDEAFERATKAMPRGPARTAREASLKAARSLVALLERRGSLCRRVAELAIGRQQEALREGLHRLRPLRMAEVAATLGCDASTVSRAVAGRWLDTPRGPVRLRDLFHWRGGSAASHEAPATTPQIHAALQALIQAEPPQRPHSDAALADLLSRRGIPAARRSVARYREQLGIPPAQGRRR